MKKTKRRLSVIVLLLLLMSVTIGYSALSSNLDITGTSKISNAKWDVHFDEPTVTRGSVTATSAPELSNEDLSITYSVVLTKPGDFYEFTVDVVNDGTVAAKLNAVPTISGVGTDQDVYTNYTFTHANGSAVAAGETIAAGDSASFKVRVEFDRNISADDLPESEQTMNLKVEMNYVQA